MDADPKIIARSVNVPSVGAIYCQAHALELELKEISPEDFSEEAGQVRNVFLCILNRVQHELLRILDTDEPYSNDNDPHFVTTRSLAKILHMVYLYVRFLRASSRKHCPPGIQAAISELVRLNFPKSLDQTPVCLVRAQPLYMAAYCEPIAELFKEFHPTLFDPTSEIFGKFDNLVVIQSLWTRWRQGLPAEQQSVLPQLPPHVSIISFAGLDDHDALLYPILAHEVGHFISFSRDPYLYFQPKIKQHIERELQRVTYSSGDEKKLVSHRVGVCLRELMADLLAVRMMGLPFFLAHAEFLKTLADWDRDSLIGKEGYPEIQVRLALVLGCLLEEEGPQGLFAFLESNRESYPYEVNVLTTLLDEWQKRLAELNGIRHVKDLVVPRSSSGSKATDKIVGEAVLGCLGELKRIAVETIPAENVPALQVSFFSRIELLKRRETPHLPNDTPASFCELMAAAWTYQVAYGENKEWNLRSNPAEIFREYDLTCQLVLDALNRTVVKRN